MGEFLSVRDGMDLVRQAGEDVLNEKLRGNSQDSPDSEASAAVSVASGDFRGGCSTVFDSHVGSGSSRIACWELGFDFEGCEIDPFYFSLEEKRFEERIKQPKLFEVKQGNPEEPELFQGDEDAER